MAESSSVSDSPSGSDSAVVELRVPADGAYAAVLRTMTATLAARLDFTLDEIEDLRIAVSEATAMVLDEADAADTGALLDTRFELAAGRLAVTITAPAAAPASPDYESFGWQVLATLATEASIDAAPGHYAVRLVVRSSLIP
jgi:serine/threonine-protein kinase RsbW